MTCLRVQAADAWAVSQMLVKRMEGAATQREAALNKRVAEAEEQATAMRQQLAQMRTNAGSAESKARALEQQLEQAHAKALAEVQGERERLHVRASAAACCALRLDSSDSCCPGPIQWLSHRCHAQHTFALCARFSSAEHHMRCCCQGELVDTACPCAHTPAPFCAHSEGSQLVQGERSHSEKALREQISKLAQQLQQRETEHGSIGAKLDEKAREAASAQRQLAEVNALLQQEREKVYRAEERINQVQQQYEVRSISPQVVQSACSLCLTTYNFMCSSASTF